ncbi:MAG: putative Ig domain-containing protein [Burkholderiaceae bacterium]|jgi:hypothetical protein|nr:putative Ig domain-containing protein [Burkholderiaceae bacterium]
MTTRFLRHLLAAFVVGVLLTSAAQAAVYPLEILAPRAGQTTANRYYKAYPGLIYDVNVAVVGGKFPYTYSLTASPSGMAIDASTGRITWPNPVAQSATYPVSVTVRDAAGNTVSVNWTILVTTSGFKFIDAVNGRTRAQGGDGSFANPWRTIPDWFVDKYNSANRDQFLYWRGGTYRTAEAPIEDGVRLANSNVKPVVWLAYPGETPVIDTTGSYILLSGAMNNAYFDGLTVQNFTKNFGILISSSSNNVQFRRNTFRNMPSNVGGTGSNASAIMIANEAVKGSNWAFLDNTFTGVYTVGYGILGYSTDRVLVERNRFTDFTVNDSKAIGPKTNNSMWFIRDNRINMERGQGIWVDTYATTRDIEISYNLVQMGSGQALWVGQEAVTYGTVTSLRNTYIGGSVQVDNLVGSSGPVSFDRDVIVNSAGTSNKITGNSSSGLSSILSTDLLVGASTSGIVDSAGNLTGSYAQFVGTRGYQRTGVTEATPPSAAANNPAPEKAPNPPSPVAVR